MTYEYLLPPVDITSQFLTRVCVELRLYDARNSKDIRHSFHEFSTSRVSAYPKNKIAMMLGETMGVVIRIARMSGYNCFVSKNL